MWQSYIDKIKTGDYKALARAISLVENEFVGYEEMLEKLPTSNVPIIGITGPPGAGKSTIVDALIELLVTQNKKVGVLCVDPSSPFNLGALLGDRVRMSEWYNHPNVYIRSLASRGSLGGLNPKIIEVSDLLKASIFDFIIIETVGVGQTELEIAGLADVTVVVLVPEAGDEVQVMKAGLMEIANIFVVNKGDRPDVNTFIKNLSFITHHAAYPIPIVKTIATQKVGIDELENSIIEILKTEIKRNTKRNWLLVEKAYQLIQYKRMKDISKEHLLKIVMKQSLPFNLYQFVKQYK
jgi:LAO/AO transport system kinase